MCYNPHTAVCVCFGSVVGVDSNSLQTGGDPDHAAAGPVASHTELAFGESRSARVLLRGLRGAQPTVNGYYGVLPHQNQREWLARRRVFPPGHRNTLVDRLPWPRSPRPQGSSKELPRHPPTYFFGLPPTSRPSRPHILTSNTGTNIWPRSQAASLPARQRERAAPSPDPLTTVTRHGSIATTEPQQPVSVLVRHL